MESVVLVFPQGAAALSLWFWLAHAWGGMLSKKTASLAVQSPLERYCVYFFILLPIPPAWFDFHQTASPALVVYATIIFRFSIRTRPISATGFIYN
jgi:hypothetical protein